MVNNDRDLEAAVQRIIDDPSATAADLLRAVNQLAAMRAERRARVQAEVDAEVNEVMATATTGTNSKRACGPRSAIPASTATLTTCRCNVRATSSSPAAVAAARASAPPGR
jgi:hypothetical protein